MKGVVGVMRHLTSAKVAHDKTAKEVSKLLYVKWFHDTVYCIPVNGIKRKLENVWMKFRKGRKRLSAGRSGKAVGYLLFSNSSIT